MANRKKTERRTFRQDRFEILIKRQKEGTATFNELTELDDLVNRDPELREKVIMENILAGDPDDTSSLPDQTIISEIRPVRTSAISKIKSFFNRLFLLKQGKPLNLHHTLIALV